MSHSFVPHLQTLHVTLSRVTRDKNGRWRQLECHATSERGLKTNTAREATAKDFECLSSSSRWKCCLFSFCSPVSPSVSLLSLHLTKFLLDIFVKCRFLKPSIWCLRMTPAKSRFPFHSRILQCYHYFLARPGDFLNQLCFSWRFEKSGFHWSFSSFHDAVDFGLDEAIHCTVWYRNI